MISFRDYYRNLVNLDFSLNPFSDNARNVFVITKFNDKWLLTKHKSRGLEFPGGKVEDGETSFQAGIREIAEETGGYIEELIYIGQYEVYSKEQTIVKDIYFGEVIRIDDQEHFYETDGPILIEDLPENLEFNTDYSFVMRDLVVKESLKRLKELNLI
ncbi:MAG: ytkD [Bacillales bacterium]|jgi:8-oxo-dGTP diphosphatase|nr:ytkD [Bacillales bacterium]